MENHSFCLSKSFKTDISELCEECPLNSKILMGIKDQIITKALSKKEYLTNVQFKKYIDKEILNASEAIDRIIITELQNKVYKTDPNRSKRIELVIWNKERIKALNKILIQLPQVENQSKLKIDQIALKYLYEGFQITRQNSNEIIEKFGYTSGEKLFQRYTYYSSTSNRIGQSGSILKLKNKITLFESVLKLLENSSSSRLVDEINILKTLLIKEDL